MVDWISYGLEKSTPEDKGVLAEVERLREKLTPTLVAEYPRTARSYEANKSK